MRAAVDSLAAVPVDPLTDMGRRGTWSSAAVALAEAAPAGEQAATALKRAPALSATGETADDAGAERDRPARGAEAGDPESCSASSRGRRGPVISRRSCSPPS
ncbi:hypothetical protein LT966_06520 [Streptomyces griseobrunneus]